MFKRQVDDALGTALTTPETEETWDKIAKAIDSLAKLFEACEDPPDGQAVMRTYARPIISAMNSERGRLSGPAINLVGVAASILGTDFETILSTYLPPLLVLCGRTNKVVLNRARTCIRSIIENTQLASILPILMHDAQDKSVTLRLVVAESMLACLSILNPPDLEREVRAKEIESSIRFAANDASADVRKVGKQLFAAYQVLLPDRVERFSAPLSPTIKKCLGITAKAQASRSRSPSHSRPPSSRSVHSNRDHHEPPAPIVKGKTRSAKAEEVHSSHQRSTSTQVSTHRTMEHAGLSKSGPSRLKAERPVKDSMPPPEFIPVRPTSAPSRQPSSSSLNGSRSTSTRPAPQPSIPGPFRPEKSQPASLRLVQTKDSTAAEKHAMPSGPRRVMLPDPDPETLEKAKTKVASNNAASTSAAVTQSVPAVKPQSFAPLKRTMSRAQLNTKVTEKPKPVVAASKPAASSTTSKTLEKTAKLNKAPESATAATAGSKINAAAMKGKGLTAPTIAQASKMKAAVEKKPATSTSTAKPTWGGRPAPPKKPQPAPAATKAVARKPPIPPRTGQLPRPIKVNPTQVPLPPSPKAGAKKLKPTLSKAPIKGQLPTRTPTPTLIPLPGSPSPAPSLSPTPDAEAEPTDVDETELVDEEEPQQTTTAPADDPGVTEERATTPATPDVTEEEGPAELQIILTTSSPCSDAPSSAAPSTPQTNQKGRPMLGQEKTPISALLASIQEGFMFTPGTPVSPSAPYVARVKAAELNMDEVLGDRRDSWAETRHVLGLEDDEIPFGISGVFSKRGREREALSNVKVNQ